MNKQCKRCHKRMSNPNSPMGLCFYCRQKVKTCNVCQKILCPSNCPEGKCYGCRHNQPYDRYSHIPDHIKDNWGKTTSDMTLEQYYRMTQSNK